MSTSSKAAYRGSCQACNAVHKLPRGVIARHGYTVEGYAFLGTCPGSARAPSEESSEFISTCILEAERQIASLREQEMLLRQPAVEAFGWVQERRAYGQRGESAWRYAPIRLLSDGLYYDDAASKTVRYRDAPRGFNGLLDACSRLNVRYADEVIVRQLSRAQLYLRWQMARRTAWSPRALIPLDADVTQRTYQDGDVDAADILNEYTTP